jgi:excisionase family DNA binding protein
MEKRLLNIRDASVYLGISVNTLRCWCSRKTIPYVKLGRMVRFNISELDQWIEKQVVEPRNSEDLLKSGLILQKSLKM